LHYRTEAYPQSFLSLVYRRSGDLVCGEGGYEQARRDGKEGEEAQMDYNGAYVTAMFLRAASRHNFRGRECIYDRLSMDHVRKHVKTALP